MTVSQLKEIVPLADVYEIKPEVKYIVKLPNGANQAMAQAAADALSEQGMNYIVVAGNIEFYEVK